MSSNGTVMNTASPKKKRSKKALEKKHKDPLPIKLTNESVTWTQYVVNALYNLIGWYHTNDRQFNGEYLREGGCIRITDNLDIQELYCKGFFGKGNLSRSEPTWSQRIAAEGSDAKQFLENITEARRKQRRATRMSKLNTPPLTSSPSQASQSEDCNNNEVRNNYYEILDTVSEEHLQLSLVEGFFLAYGLGCLEIMNSEKQPLSIIECWKLFCNDTLKNRSEDAEVVSSMPLAQTLQSPMEYIGYDNPFIVKYVAYHHYRSKAWVVKDGIKFGTDYIIYQRGPAFHHGEFAIIIIPSYHETSNKQENLSWSWILGMNRVCSQANKTLVLCYVNLPPQTTVHCLSPECLTQYSVTEMAMKRWIPEKTRS
ncbi:hypothetical protein K450DRAFT_262265 [Umbelopsis ramanniana AG]|uniref:tRNA-splicing endonuclease subunit Sen2 n=1 Tax=Umbelopsis ramanniana AG TaxID=1314678 RepID=A0AAD5E214_UMBRA|nr:uncharacterized protein K450DRAFT_262265 [Umbelopsis ramanniana AG]KAI8575334.1 hypothetical protein K450DRAFT_262265 [Umbelopsis ramanniana AG]